MDKKYTTPVQLVDYLVQEIVQGVHKSHEDAKTGGFGDAVSTLSFGGRCPDTKKPITFKLKVQVQALIGDYPKR